MYPSDLWVTDPNSGQLFKIESDLLTLNSKSPTGTTAVHVAQDMLHVYVASSYLEEVASSTSTTSSPGSLVGYSAATDTNSGLVGTTVTTTTQTLQRHRVSKYRNGIKVQDIDVGRQPCAFAEDGNGNIWVANYADNTVQKITKGQVVKTITVHAGPRDIIADSRNKVYVACYTGNCVDVITNDVLVDSIDVANGPRAITCDYVDNIWVACFTANVLTKIKNDKKILDIELKDYGRSPCDIVVNSEGIVYVANYFGNNVLSIKTEEDGAGTSATIQNSIPVHQGPTALGLTKDDTIYVLSEIDGVIDKIVGDVRTTYFDICTNPTGFGDFTGCETYNIYHYDGKSSDRMPIGGWTRTYLSNDIQQLLGQIESGSVETSADLVTYNNSKYPTVEAALDALFSVDPVITEFTIPNNMFEYGQTINTLTIQWGFNTPMKHVEIRMGSTTIIDFDNVYPSDTTTIPLTGSYPFPVSINNPTTSEAVSLQMWATADQDGATPIMKSATIYFGNKILYGTLKDGIMTVSQNDLDTCDKSSIFVSSTGAEDKKRPFSKYFYIDCGITGDQCPIIAVPASWGVTSRQVTFTNGYVNDWTKLTISYSNEQNAERTYDVFLYGTALAGDFVGTIIELV